ncbi:hypothetical protein HDC30_005785 [Pseudomonas sp. JAI115]|uniref:hypothetical protein n=1 Tax=Pseudomonas sp. JAI115 TaxID=2723061 RepID=UPI00160F1559|nr:hypothetical protein [Pseudomonas sp. JAI115]MBB6158527.1 hypothetical protein [Pseudomonas sp. JAI115]
MNWAPVTLRWPAQSTQWMDSLDSAKQLAGSELANTAQRLGKLEGLASTAPGPVGAAASGAAQAGRAALSAQLGQAPACLAVTPFQPGVGQGSGYQRFLSAPNLVQLLGDRLLDSSAQARLAEAPQALVILFLATRFEQLADSLGRFNALLPVPELQRAENRARHLSRLEAEKWQLPIANTLPGWGSLPLERCTLTKAAGQALSGQLAMLEGYAADSSPLADLAGLAQRKAAQSERRNGQLNALKAQLANAGTDTTMVTRLLETGSGAELRRQLLAVPPPGHEWVLCAGLLLVGPPAGLSFVQELVGL